MDFSAKHIRHYLPLLGILGAGIIGFGMFSYDKSFQMTVVAATSFSYAVWGVVHHKMHDDLHLSVFLEYVSIAFLGTVAVYLLLF